MAKVTLTYGIGFKFKSKLLEAEIRNTVAKMESTVTLSTVTYKNVK
jgi:hypothetical protein